MGYQGPKNLFQKETVSKTAYETVGENYPCNLKLRSLVTLILVILMALFQELF